jgi:hypothetical protein
LEQEAGVGTAPEGHGRWVYGFVGIAVGRDIIEEAVSRGEVVLVLGRGRVGLVG